MKTEYPDSSRTAATAADIKIILQHRKDVIVSWRRKLRNKLRPCWSDCLRELAAGKPWRWMHVNAADKKSFTCLRSLETRSRHIDGILKRKDIQDSKHPDLRLPVLLPMDQRLKAGEHWGSQEECGNASGSCQNLWGSLNSKLISLFGHVWTCLVPKISVTVENLG